MKATERISTALNIPEGQVSATVAALLAALETDRKRRSPQRVANIMAAIITKQSTTQYNQNDIAFAKEWIANKLSRHSYRG